MNNYNTIYDIKSRLTFLNFTHKTENISSGANIYLNNKFYLREDIMRNVTQERWTISR